MERGQVANERIELTDAQSNLARGGVAGKGPPGSVQATIKAELPQGVMQLVDVNLAVAIPVEAHEGRTHVVVDTCEGMRRCARCMVRLINGR